MRHRCAICLLLRTDAAEGTSCPSCRQTLAWIVQAHDTGCTAHGRPPGHEERIERYAGMIRDGQHITFDRATDLFPSGGPV